MLSNCFLNKKYIKGELYFYGNLIYFLNIVALKLC
jgi:hypothetical protein